MYEKDLSIDQDSLDQEWLKQPQLYFRYAQESEKLQNQVRKAKEKLEVIDAEIEKEIRQDTKKNGEKVTEKAISTEILLTPKHRTASDALSELEHEYRIVGKVALPAIEQKKSALENLVKLYCAGYWAEPREPKKSDIQEKAIDIGDEKQVKNLNKKRKK